MRLLYRFRLDFCRYHLFRSLPQFNVTLDDNVSKLIGRILAPPRINYGQSSESLVERGEWKMARNKQKFFDGSGFKTFALLVKDVQMARAAEDFMKGFFASANQLGACSFNPFPSSVLTRRRAGLRAPRDFPRGTAYIAGSQAPSQAIGAALHHARTAFCTPQIDVIFWAFDLKKDERYDQFKTEGAFKLLLRRGRADEDSRHVLRDPYAGYSVEELEEGGELPVCHQVGLVLFVSCGVELILRLRAAWP